MSVLLGADLLASVVLIAVGEPWSRWAAVVIVGLVAVPLLTPVTLLLLSVAIGWLTGKPARWN